MQREKECVCGWVGVGRECVGEGVCVGGRCGGERECIGGEMGCGVSGRTKSKIETRKETKRTLTTSYGSKTIGTWPFLDYSPGPRVLDHEHNQIVFKICDEL